MYTEYLLWVFYIKKYQHWEQGKKSYGRKYSCQTWLITCVLHKFPIYIHTTSQEPVIISILKL